MVDRRKEKGLSALIRAVCPSWRKCHGIASPPPAQRLAPKRIRTARTALARIATTRRVRDRPRFTRALHPYRLLFPGNAETVDPVSHAPPLVSTMPRRAVQDHPTHPSCPGARPASRPSPRPVPTISLDPAIPHQRRALTLVMLSCIVSIVESICCWMSAIWRSLSEV